MDSAEVRKWMRCEIRRCAADAGVLPSTSRRTCAENAADRHLDNIPFYCARTLDCRTCSSAW